MMKKSILNPAVACALAAVCVSPFAASAMDWSSDFSFANPPVPPSASSNKMSDVKPPEASGTYKRSPALEKLLGKPKAAPSATPKSQPLDLEAWGSDYFQILKDFNTKSIKTHQTVDLSGQAVEKISKETIVQVLELDAIFNSLQDLQEYKDNTSEYDAKKALLNEVIKAAKEEYLPSELDSLQEKIKEKTDKIIEKVDEDKEIHEKAIKEPAVKDALDKGDKAPYDKAVSDLRADLEKQKEAVAYKTATDKIAATFSNILSNSKVLDQLKETTPLSQIEKFQLILDTALENSGK